MPKFGVSLEAEYRIARYIWDRCAPAFEAIATIDVGLLAKKGGAAAQLGLMTVTSSFPLAPPRPAHPRMAESLPARLQGACLDRKEIAGSPAACLI